jgi:hypothetical protein
LHFIVVDNVFLISLSCYLWTIAWWLIIINIGKAISTSVFINLVNWFLQGTLATSFLKCGEYSFFDIDALSNDIPNRSNLLLQWSIFVFLYFHLLGHVSQNLPWHHSSTSTPNLILIFLQTSKFLVTFYLNIGVAKPSLKYGLGSQLVLSNSWFFLQEPLGLGLGNSFKFLNPLVSKARLDFLNNDFTSNGCNIYKNLEL